MCDPSSAFAVAATVVTFINFTGKLLVATRSVAETGKGATASNADLDLISRDILALNEKLTAPAAVGAIPDSLRELASESKDVARELLTHLESMRGNQPRGKWGNFVQALKATAGESRTVHLIRRVERLRDQMHFRLQVTMSGTQSEILALLQSLVDENARLETNRTQELQKLIGQVRQTLTSLDAKAKVNDIRIDEIFDAAQRFEPVDKSAIDVLSQNMASLSDILEGIALESGAVAKEQLALKSLWFKSMTLRQDTAETAAAETFEWIFEPASEAKFLDWLHHKNGLYWISGKAGSGKTTLMKFLINDPRTAAALTHWAKPNRLVTTSFFFWNPGSNLQKSQEGLLRSILYQILRSCPELIQPVCESKLQTYRPFGGDLEPWTRSQLWEAIEKLSRQQKTPTKFCIFVDSLDEYSGPTSEIVRIIQGLRAFTSLKLCISSRPWNEFTNAFGADPNFQLLLEDFTSSDIRKYISQQLEEDPRFKLAKSSDERYQDLVQDIVGAARGVFLWVFLVVEELLRSLGNRDGINDLRRRLKDLPPTLEGMFERMLNSVDPFYRPKMAKTLSLALYTPNPLTLLTYWIVDEELDARAFESHEQLRKTDAAKASDDMRWRMNSRTMGLLEVVDQPGPSDVKVSSLLQPSVEFIHRTARDFLLTEHAQSQLSKLTPNAFSPSQCLCAALLCFIKLLGKDFKSDPDVIGHLLEDLAYFARQRENETDSLETKLLDETERALRASPLTQARQTADKFLGLMISNGIHGYVRAKIEEHPQIVLDSEVPLLLLALDPSENVIEDAIPIEMVKLLLEKGAEVNQTYKGRTIWGHFCLALAGVERNPWDGRERRSQYLVTRLLIQYGADLSIKLVVGHRTLPARRETGRAADLHKKPGTMPLYKTATQIIQEEYLLDEAKELLSLRQMSNRSLIAREKTAKSGLFNRILNRSWTI